MSYFKGYYDQPEGQDAFGKIVAINKIALACGLTWSTLDVLMYSKTQGYWPTLYRIGYNTLPLMGMASAFTLTTYAATNMRHKDDRINYFLGGLSAGGIYGCWQRSVPAGMSAALFLGIFATIKKLSIQEGWSFFPDIVHEHGSLNWVTHDYTLLAEREKGWTNKKEA